MKLLLLSLFLVGAGAGGYGLTVEAVDAPAPLSLGACTVECPPEDGRLTIERVGPDTCRITCYDERNEIRCQEEIVCDETDRPCDRPCERASSCPR